MKTIYSPLFSSMLVIQFLLSTLASFFIIEKSNAQSYPDGFSKVKVASGIIKPTVLAFAPDGRIFVAEQAGNLRVIKNGSLLSKPFISLNVNSSGERGLIGIALDPNFATNHYVYLYYTLPDGSRNRISRFTANGDVVVPGSEVVVLNLDPLSASNHNGGAMHFGKDGKLYVAIGDNANPTNAQNLDTYHGKLLRINPNGSVPAGNPFTYGSAQKKRIWAYGLRNPYTLDIQSGTGKIFVNDVGQDSWEEVNDATAGGHNFGWPSAEGNSSNSTYTNPVYTYPHGSGDGKGCAITGGTFFNPSSTNYPAKYVGKFFFVDFCNKWINMLNLSGEVTRLPFATGVGGNVLSLKTGIDGNLYYLSRSTGALYKLIYSKVNAPAITNHPDNVTIPAGQPASFSVSASGATPFTYQWQKNGVNISGATAAIYSINSARLSDAGAYRAIVKNSAGSATSKAATLTVTRFNAKPVSKIITPAEGTLYRAGNTITFSGNATDKEDGTLPASAFTWEVVFHHSSHSHDGPPIASGTKSGSFVIPNQGETSDAVWYRLYLTVTDSKGASATTYRNIYPQKSKLSFATVPAGLKLTLDGRPFLTPASVKSVEGILRTIGVVSPQTVNGVKYAFDHWQHGGKATQTIATPEENVTYTAVFKKVSGVPSPWQSRDIGNVAAAGNASASNGTFTITGSGADIWNRADEFHYVYQTLSGDGEIVGQVTEIANTDAWAKAGLMFRETLAANAKHASVFVTPSRGVSFQRRTTTGSTSQSTGSSGNKPVWLKVTRAGNTFTSFKSLDGTNWKQIGSATVDMNADIFVGLAVTAHKDGALNTSVFKNVSVNSNGNFKPIVLEAEAATVSGGKIATDHSGFTGSGFVDYINSNSDYTEWSVKVPSSGTYALAFRYALGASSSRPLEIKVNGVIASGLDFAPTGSWTAWKTVNTSVALSAGVNTIRATATGASGANVDHLKVQAGNGSTNAVFAKISKSVQPVGKSNLQVFPNPTDDVIFVNKYELMEDAEFQLIDINGRVIPIQAIHDEGTLIQLNLPNLKTGIYTLSIRSGNQIITEKIILKP